MRMSSAVRLLVFAFLLLSFSAASFGQIGISISIAPPALPVYEQPPCPGDGYLWTPGYWAWDTDYDDYYWVPGTWVMAPEVGFLWTPPYWGWGDGGYVFYSGYWGPVVGFYGGIDYGFGYFGRGFEGGRWERGHFFYNRSVVNVNVTEVHNVYNERVENRSVNRISYNGGNGGVSARPTPQEEAAAHARHIPPVAAQTQHIQEARSNPELRASRNEGKPPVAATERAGDFKGHGVVQAKEAGAPYHPPAKGQNPIARNNAARTETNAPRGETNAGRPAENTPRDTKGAVHPHELPPSEKPAAPNTGNAKQDKKYQQQQEKLMSNQNKEREKLQKQQDKEHQQLAKQQANDEKKQQVEQKHQQQTQQLQARHTQQMQHLQQRQRPARTPPPAKPPKGKG